jgi:hypothetical protein
MREGYNANRRSPAKNPDPEKLEPPEGDCYHLGYAVLSKAERGRPREEMSERMGWDEGPFNSISYPDQ